MCLTIELTDQYDKDPQNPVLPWAPGALTCCLWNSLPCHLQWLWGHNKWPESWVLVDHVKWAKHTIRREQDQNWGWSKDPLITCQRPHISPTVKASYSVPTGIASFNISYISTFLLSFASLFPCFSVSAQISFFILLYSFMFLTSCFIKGLFDNWMSSPEWQSPTFTHQFLCQAFSDFEAVIFSHWYSAPSFNSFQQSPHSIGPCLLINIHMHKLQNGIATEEAF